LKSSELLIFKEVKLVASTKKNKIIGTQEISFKLPNYSRKRSRLSCDKANAISFTHDNLAFLDMV